MRKRFMSVTAMSLIMISSLSACSTNSISKIESLPLVDPLSKREITDYYTEEMKVKSITKRASLIQSNELIQYRELSPEEMPKIEQELQRVENLLSKGEYEFDKYVTPQLHGYMKYSIDDKILTRKGIEFKGATREFYVIDVAYDMKYKGEGSLKADAKYLGVHGAFYKDSLGKDKQDKEYIKKVEEAVKEEQKNNDTKARTGEMSISELLRKRGENQWIGKKVDLYETKPVEVPDAPGVQTNENGPKKAEDLNVEAMNNILGSSMRATAYMPELSMVFTPSASGGNLSGYGIYAQGSGILKEFGVERNKLGGKVVVRYIFRSEIGNEQVVHLDNVYLKSMDVTGVPEIENKDKSVFPQFAEQAIIAQLDRADRLKMNNDTYGFMGGQVYSNMRVGILEGMGDKFTIFHRTVTDVEKINGDYVGFLKRDGNKWLIKAISTVKEEARFNAGGEGIWQEEWLIALEQQGDNFVIADKLMIGKSLIKDVDAQAGSNLVKRYTYLSLSGPIDPDRRVELNEFLKTFVEVLNNKEWQAVYDTLNTNTEMLSKTRRDYIYSTFKNNVSKEGSDQKATYYGAITEWLGGAKEQAEFTTMELVKYDSLNKAMLTSNYYLVSKFEDRWVIDEVKSLDTTMLTGDAIQDKILEIQSYNKTTSQAESKKEVPKETTKETNAQ